MKACRLSEKSLAKVLGLFLTIMVTPACKSSDPETAEPVRPAVSQVPAPGWQDGARYGGATELESSLTAGGQPLMVFALRGKLVLEARQSEDRIDFAAWLAEAKFKADDAANQGQFDSLAQELSIPFGFALVQGKLSQVRLRPNATPFASSITRTLAAAIQFAAPQANVPAGTWTATEVDATGKYEAEYSLLAGSTSISKRKQRYLGVGTGKLTLPGVSPQLAPQVIASAGTLALVDEAKSPTKKRLAGVTYAERLQTTLTSTSRVDSATTLKISLDRIEPHEPFDWQKGLAATQPQAPDAMSTQRVPVEAYDRERIGNYTFDKALREIEQQAGSGKKEDLIEAVLGESVDDQTVSARKASFAKQGKAFTALAAILRQDPKTLPLVVARVRAGSVASGHLIGALASAGTGAAQTALVGLMDDAKLDQSMRRAAAFALGRSERATPATVTALEQHVGDGDSMRVHALYGLGTISRRLRENGDSERAEAIVQLLLRRLAAASEPGSKMDTLRALANAGSNTAFEAVRPLLNDPSTRMRAAAIDAIRLVSHPEADGIIARQASDSDERVQAAALDAMSVRQPTDVLVAGLKACASSSKIAASRSKAVRIMGAWLSQRPDLRQALEQLAASDANERVRSDAKRALGG